MLFYKKSPTTSRSQLLNDFGDFPPKPLADDLTNRNFDVVYLSGLGNQYFLMSRFVRGLMGDPEDLIDSELIQFQKEHVESKIKFMSTYKGLNFFQKAGLFVVIFFALPLIFFGMGVYFIGAFYKFSKSKSAGSSVVGFFNPTSQQKSEIAIKPKIIKKSKSILPAIVSHEHIHLLQHNAFMERRKDLRKVEHNTNLRKFLTEKFLESESAFYYLELNEVEARLHEVVLSYYRAHGQLPVDYRGFLIMILSCEFLGDHAARVLSEHDIILPESESYNYQMRDVTAAREIAVMFMFFSGGNYPKRFICEALSVMYGNLIIIYGDPMSASEYLKTIINTDFYINLYGVDTP